MSGRLRKSLKRKSIRRRVIRYGLITLNVLILAGVVGFVATSSRGGDALSASVLASSDEAAAAANPVDGLTSYDIAANVASMTDLPERAAITNQAQSAKVALAVSASASNSDVVVKPQIVATTLKSRDDIHSYTVAPGDTVASIAQKFGVTADSIKWSNNLLSGAVTAGSKLVIPPINGIVYTVKPGDTIQSLASQYRADASQITAYNDAEIAGIAPGEQILIPNGQVQQSFSYFGWSYAPSYGGNGYDFGQCTWYVASQIAVPRNWGNANTWDDFARQTPGWQVGSTPRVGAIAQSDTMSYYGHVAIVDAVSPDGTMIQFRDMNNYSDGGGYDRVGHSGWVPASRFEHYIYQ